MDIAAVIVGLAGSALSAVMGLGWLRSRDQVRLAELRVEEARAQVAGEQIRNESAAFKLYEDAAAALQATNKASQEANHYSDEMRAENRRLRELQAQMRTDLDGCVAARAIGAETTARMTQQLAETRAAIQVDKLAMHAEIAELRRQLEAAQPGATTGGGEKGGQ